jgi:drug/metabolite transporter (DMT)-like permease
VLGDVDQPAPRRLPRHGALIGAAPASPRPRALAGLSLGVLAVSWGAILARLAEAPALSVAAWRMLLAGVPAALFALAARRRELAALDRRSRRLLLGAGAALALHFATWIASLRLTSVASSVALVSTQPVWVALLSRPLLGERVGRRAALGIGLAVAGALVVAGADLSAGEAALRGDALALAGALGAALYFLAGRRVRARLSLGAYVGVVYPAAALALLALAAGAGAPLAGFAGSTWAALLGLALVPQLLGHSLLNWSLRWLSAPFVAVAVLAEPVLATLLAVPVLGERPGAWQAAGGALTLAGVFLAAGEEARRTAPEARSEEVAG